MTPSMGNSESVTLTGLQLPSDPGPWPAGLTVEAVLAAGPDGSQAQWAVDVMKVPVPASTAAGMAEARQQLRVPAARLAKSAHRAVTVSIRIPASDSAARRAYYQEVLTRVEEALRTGSDYYDASGKDPATQVLLSDGEFLGDPSGPHGAVRVHLAPFTGGTPDLLAELQSTLVAPLDKKLGNQLKCARPRPSQPAALGPGGQPEHARRNDMASFSECGRDHRGAARRRLPRRPRCRSPRPA
jgi:hypothetical protein